MPEERFKLNAAVYLLLIKDNKIVLLRRANTGWADGNYIVPSGHIDGNEPLTAAACREAREEAGVMIRPEDLQFVHVMHRKDIYGDQKEYLDFFFAAAKWEGEPYNAEPGKCDDLRWFPLDALPETVLPFVKVVVDEYQSGEPFSEVGWL